ncbi:MAG: class I SAM-dependent methyltransferase [Phycisphaerales bacterium]|jgi:SAM-dependent methyltransferase
MIARKSISNEYAAWNRTHKAPAGPAWWDRVTHSRLRSLFWPRRMRLPGPLVRSLGAFAFQANSDTRTVEYPWCWFAGALKPGMTVVDVGAGAAGLQFVMSAAGINVLSVDPLLNPSEKVRWEFSEADFDRLNRVMGSKVVFIRKLLQDAKLEADSIDRVFAVSVIEHIPLEGARELMAEVRRILKPGGLFIGTVDLFLDLAPFTSSTSNKYGTNVPVSMLVESSGLELVSGDRRELYGFPEFDPQSITKRRDEFFVANNVCAQCIVLRKPERA